jgi:dienelactone hydrolase
MASGPSALGKDKSDAESLLRGELHLLDPPPKLQTEQNGSFPVAPGVVADRVSYATDYSLRIPAIVYHSADKRRRRGPALVIVNGHGGDKSSWYAYWAGILYARAGGVVLTYDPIGEFERNHLRFSGTNQHDDPLQPEDMGRRMGGLMVRDVLQGTRYLSTRKDVNRKRIAILGYSMGSFISSLACAIDNRASACVLVGGGDLDGPGGYWDSSHKVMCQAIPYQKLRVLGDRGAAIYALQARHADTFVYNGSADSVVDIPNHGPDFFADLQKRTQAVSGRKRVFSYTFAPGGGHRPYFLTKPVALWLQEHLQFPQWTREKLEAMPEVQVSNWATSVGLPNPGLQNQLHEGGTMALQDGIRPVNRSLLLSLPEAHWSERSYQYVYETWVDRAQSAIRSGAP